MPRRCRIRPAGDCGYVRDVEDAAYLHGGRQRKPGRQYRRDCSSTRCRPGRLCRRRRGHRARGRPERAAGSDRHLAGRPGHAPRAAHRSNPDRALQADIWLDRRCEDGRAYRRGHSRRRHTGCEDPRRLAGGQALGGVDLRRRPDERRNAADHPCRRHVVAGRLAVRSAKAGGRAADRRRLDPRLLHADRDAPAMPRPAGRRPVPRTAQHSAGR